MSRFYVWLTAHEGEATPMPLKDWNDDEGALELQLSAFAKDAVITIEPMPEELEPKL
jgi:NAD(P)H-flavin reductase